MTLNNTQAIILAAGKGSRMGDLPYQKSMLPAKTGKHMIAYTLKSLFQAGFDNHHITTVVSHKKETVEAYIGADSQYVIQQILAGTADAVHKVLSVLDDTITNILVLNGDDSLSYRKEVVQEILTHHTNSDNTITVGVTGEHTPSVHKQSYIAGSDYQLRAICPVEEKRGFYLNGICVMTVAYVHSVIEELTSSLPADKEFGIPHIYKKALQDGRAIGIHQSAYQTYAMNTIEDWRRNMTR